MPKRDYSLCSDNILLILLRNSDNKAFDQIYIRYWEQLFIYVAKVVTDREEAKDIVQEIFVSMWGRRATLVEIDSLKGYLYSAARYKGLTYIKENVNKNKYLEALSSFYEYEYDEVNEQLAFNELNTLINREIEKLPAKMKEVFILSRQENLSHKWIAEKLMISDKTVKKQINNVLKRFRLKFADK